MQWVFLFLGLGLLGTTGGIGISAAVKGNFITAGILLVVFVYLVLGFKTVQQQERRVVEFFGAYLMTLSPTPLWHIRSGLRWIVPGVMKIRATISVWEERLVLFEQPIKIDFKDGSATPKGAEAFVRLKKPDEVYRIEDEFPDQPPEDPRFVGTGVYRAIYNIANWRIAVRDLLENAIRSYLNGLTIDEGITQARAGFELLNQLPPSERNRLHLTLARWGLELMRITVMDFDLEPELVKARGEVQIRQRAADAAKHEAQIRARETIGMLVAMIAEMVGRRVEEVQTEIANNPALRDRLQTVAEDLVSRQVSIAGKALTDIRVAGAGDLGNAIAAIIAAIKKA